MKVIEHYIRARQNDKNLEYNPSEWLDSAAKRASQISMATHVLKYTHSEAKGTNILSDTSLESDELLAYISTTALDHIQKDVVGNAGALDIAGFLLLEEDGVTLLDRIATNNSAFLKPFAKDEIQLSTWMKGFQSVLVDKHLSSHHLAKQVYFPVGDQYHLLSPLFSSSLYHAIHEKIEKDLFSKHAKAVRQFKKKQEFSEDIVIDYPDLGIQKHGGAHPKNISKLNSEHRGVVYLLRSLPPLWKHIKKPPLKKDLFWKHLAYENRMLINDFRGYLESLPEDKNNEETRSTIKEYIYQILDSFVHSATQIQEEFNPGWSQESELTIYERLWLDPYQDDRDFQFQYRQKLWMEEVAARFARWLVDKLKSDKLEFWDLHHQKLKVMCLETLTPV
jgi:CRISPR-associated protein Csy1